MTYTQENRLMAINTPLGDDALLLSGFSGEEGISRLFRFDLELLSTSESVDFAAIVGKNVTIRLTLAGDTDRYFNGFISRFAQGGRDANLVSYRAEMVPWLWFLTRTADCRIFQNKKAPDIVKQIFDEMGFKDYKLQLYGDFAEREYCVQYRETDFNFISRLLEEEGIFYFFEHQNGLHTLVLANAPAAHQPCPNQPRARYETTTGGHQDEDVLLEWRVQQELRPGVYMQADYNFEQPNDILRSNVAGKSAYEIYDYHVGDYKKMSEGDSLVRTRLQELEAPIMVAQGSSDCRAFTTGYRFDLTEHYRSDMNQPWVLTSLRHTATQPGDFQAGSGGDGFYYRNSFECIPLSTPLRPARVTPQPLVQGSQTAVVVGPAGEEIYVDQYGRVKVQFHWDREGKKDDNSSCWIRVSQLWAGKKWGAMFVPRIGQEVIVDFLEGDPDQPIITGRVYNAEQVPPYKLPDEKTKSTIKSNSSPGGGGFNELRFEDKKGDEQIFINAEKNLDVRVKNNEYKTIEKELHLVVDQAKYTHVKDKQHETVDSDVMVKIGSDHHLNITGKQAIQVGGSHSFQVGGNVAEVFSQNHTEQTSMNLYIDAGMGIVIEASTGITLKCGGNSVVIDPVGVTLTGSLVVLNGQMTLINSGPGSPAMSGSAGNAVSPTDPDPAHDADKADPGEMAQLKSEQIKQQKGKYGSVKIAPHHSSGGAAGAAAAAASAAEQEKKKHWVEIELADEDGKPVTGEPYRIILPDGATAASGTLDEKGFARVDGIKDPGSCKVIFPNRDKQSWKGK